jgi:hypothetical protein
MELIARIAYFAGIVDGEGTIHIVRQTTNRSKPGRPPYITGGFYVTNSDRTLLTWIQRNFGGNIGLARRKVGANWKPVYRIQFYGKSAERLIRMVQPYLIAKREQANLYLELRDRIRKYPSPLSADERAIREELWFRCKQLNHRGIGQAERPSELAPLKVVTNG